MKPILTAVLLVTALYALSSNAAVTITVEQVGEDVVATATGSVDLTDLVIATNGTGSPFIGLGSVMLGGPTWLLYDIPISDNFLGPIGLVPPNTSDGAGVGILGDGSTSTRLALDLFYLLNPDEPIAVTTTWFGVTLAQMQVTPGTYTWQWGNSSPDSLTLTIVNPNPPIPVPSLSRYGLLLIMLGMIGIAWRRIRSV